MNAALLIKFWREILILLLAVISLSAIKACSAEHDKAATIHAQQQAIVEKQKQDNEDQKRHDQQAAEQTKHELQQTIDKLNSDHRIASIRVCKQSGSSSLPSTTATPAGTASENSTGIPQTVITDFGPAIDELTRECDALAARHNALVDWVISTR